MAPEFNLKKNTISISASDFMINMAFIMPYKTC